VAECLAEEKQRLLPLPATPAVTDRVQPAHVDSTAFVRFDTNSYSVPAHYAGAPLTLVADDSTVRLLEGAQEVAHHARCWGRRQLVEAHEHREALLALKRRARETKGQDRLRTAVPNVDALFARWVEAGRNVGSLTARTLRLLDAYGDALLVASALADLLRQESMPALDRRMRRYTQSDLLILDEFDYLPCLKGWSVRQSPGSARRPA
jgi:hypothetical protein